jgi:hypothetical protein
MRVRCLQSVGELLQLRFVSEFSLSTSCDSRSSTPQYFFHGERCTLLECDMQVIREEPHVTLNRWPYVMWLGSRTPALGRFNSNCAAANAICADISALKIASPAPANQEKATEVLQTIARPGNLNFIFWLSLIHCSICLSDCAVSLELPGPLLAPLSTLPLPHLPELY